MLRTTKLGGGGARTGTKPLTPNTRLFPGPHSPSRLFLLLPLCKLLASSKAHCKSFSCENFPDCPQSRLCLHFPCSLCSALTLLASHLLHYVATIYVPVFPAGLKAIQGRRWVLLIPGCGPNTSQAHLVPVNGCGNGKDEAWGSSLLCSLLTALEHGHSPVTKGCGCPPGARSGHTLWCQAVVLSSCPCMGSSWSEKQSTPESSCSYSTLVGTNGQGTTCSGIT